MGVAALGEVMPDPRHPLVDLCESTALNSGVFSPDNSSYDARLGLWVDDSGIPTVQASNRPKPETKKFDVETGEDHKGT